MPKPPVASLEEVLPGGPGRRRPFVEDGAATLEGDRDTAPAPHDLIVRAGRRGRLRSNGRFRDAGTGLWWYEQVTVNVAWFRAEPSELVFVESPPERDVRLLSDLW